MSFLTPLYILGLGVVSLPFVLHLIRRQPRGRIPFSTVMFFKPSPPRMSRKSHIENWLLLMLRMTAICLAAFAFSRPFYRSERWNRKTEGNGKTVLILLDTSASMKRGNLWQQALDKVHETLASAEPSDRLAILTFDSSMNSVIDFKEWDALMPKVRTQIVGERLKSLAPGWAATNLKTALTFGIEKLQAEEETTLHTKAIKNAIKRLQVISDFQKGSRIESWDTDVWPANIDLQMETLEATSVNNAGLHLLSMNRKADDSSVIQVRLKVTNAENSQKNSFSIHWNSFSGKEDTISLTVEPAISRTIVVELHPRKIATTPDSSKIRTVSQETPASVSPVKFTLVGDDYPFDNEVIAFEPKTERVRVLYYGDDTDDGSNGMRNFLEKAYLPTPRRHIDLASQHDGAPAVLFDGSSTATPLAVVTCKISASHLKAMKRYLSRGGTVLVVLKNKSTVNTLAALLDRVEIEASEQQPDRETRFQEIDFDHFLFQPFDSPEFSDFSKIFIWKYRKIDAKQFSHAKILARFDNGDPAILEIPQGNGSIVVFTTSWRLEDSQLALSSKFAPLMNRLLEFNRPENGDNRRYEIGDSVHIPKLGGNLEADPRTVVTTPLRESVTLADGQQEFRNTSQPGVYSFVSMNNEFVVQVHRSEEESDTAPMNMDTFDALGLTVKTLEVKQETHTKVERQQQLMSKELENEQKFWWWLILLTVLVLLLETWVAGQKSRLVQMKRAIAPGTIK